MPLRPALLLSFLLLTAACTEPATAPAALKDEVVRVSGLPLFARAAGEGPPILYLNRCPNGCTVEPGPDDSRSDRSSILTAPAHLPAYTPDPAYWRAALTCVQAAFEPFELVVTDVEPAPGVPHFETFVSGHPSDAGFGPEVGGVSPLACGVIENGVNFAFAHHIGDLDPRALCVTIAHEAGHTFGLEHTFHCGDVMTYLPECRDQKRFLRADNRCGTHGAEDCGCHGPHQNNFLTLLDAFGPRQTPVAWRPQVSVVEPGPAQALVPGRWLWAEAEHRGAAIREVRFRLDGADLGAATEAPYGARTPPHLSLGPHTLEVTAVSETGETVTAERTLRVGPEPASEAHRQGGLLLAVLGLALFARRRGALALTMVLLGCQDEARLGATAPALIASPEPGTRLVLRAVEGEGAAEPVPIVLANAGAGPLRLLAPPRLEGDAPLFAYPPPSPILPGASVELWVRARPSTLGIDSGTLVLETDDPKARRITWPVRLETADRCRLAFDEDVLDLDLGEARAVTLRTVSAAPCELTALDLDPRLFTLADPPPLPRTLASGQALVLTVVHHTRTVDPGRPVRALRARPADGPIATLDVTGVLPVSGCVDVFPRALDFGEVDAGDMTRRRVVLTNRCDEALTLTEGTIGAGGASFSVEADSLPAEVPPGGQLGIWVRVHAVQPEDLPGRLNLSTTDAAFRRLRIPLSAQPRFPRVLHPPRVDLGETSADPSCRSPQARVPFFNVGEGSLRVDTLELEGEGFLLDGALLDGQPAELGGLRVPPGSTLTALVRFRPEGSQGARSGTLTLPRGSQRYAVALGAVATEASEIEHRRTQPAGPKVDLLFVVDDSASMKEAQPRLAQAAERLIDAAAELRADLQVMVARADVDASALNAVHACAAGPILRSESGASAGDLACALSVGTSGIGRQAALEAALQLLDASVVADADESTITALEGFVRLDARLHVVVVSNEADLSRASALTSSAFLLGLKLGRLSQVGLHAWARPEVGEACVGLTHLTAPGDRYLSLAHLFGGAAHDICAGDAEGFLEDVAALAFQPPSRHLIPTRARVREVWVDGEPLSADRFVAHPGAAELELLEPLPPPGAELTLRYAPACE